MANFVPCSSNFQDAVKDKTSARYWQVLIDTDDDDVLEDVTSYILNNDVSGSGRLEGSFNEAVSNQYKVTLRNPGGIFHEGDFAFAKCEIRAKVGTAEYITIFTGFVDEEGCARNIGYVSEDTVTVSMFDRSKHIAMRRKVPKSVYINMKISDPVTTSSSIFHNLAYLLGLSDSDLVLGGAIDYTKPYLPLDGSEKVWSELQALAVQYLGQLTFRYDGKLLLRSRHETGWVDPSAEWTFSEAENNIHKIKSRGGKIIANRVITEFDVHTVLSSRQIYRSVQGYNVVTGKCSIPVAPGEYWPGGTNANNTAELKYLEPDTGEKYPIAINVQTPSIGASGSDSDIECDGGVLTLESFNGTAGTNPSKTVQNPGSSQIILKNTTGSTITITKLDLFGQPIRVDEKVEVKDQDGTIVDEWEYRDKTIDGKYAVSPAQATITTQWWVEYGKVKRKTFELETDWIPQVQEGALVNLIMPTYDINMVCEVMSWNHPAAKGPMGKQITKLILREWISLTPASEPYSTVYQEQGLATVEGVDDTAQILSTKPSFTDLQDGYNAGGGTTTPATPVIKMCEAVGKNAIFLMTDIQLNLTNFKQYEWQVCADSGGSPDGNWYELRFDGVDWKDQADPFFTIRVYPSFSHTNIPYTGTVDNPAGRKLHYRVRLVNKDDSKSSWSSTASATTKIVEAGDIAVNSIYAASIIASQINTLFLRASGSIIVGQDGNPDSPIDGDLRTRIDDQVIRIAEQYTGGSWTMIKGIVLGLLTCLIGCQGLYHPENPIDDTEFFPNNNFLVYDFDGDKENQYGIDDWNGSFPLVYDSTNKKFGTHSATGPYTINQGVQITGNTGESQSFSAWSRCVNKNETAVEGLYLFSVGEGTVNGLIRLYADTDGFVWNYRVRLERNSIETNLVATDTFADGEWSFAAVIYKKETDTLYLVSNGNLYSTSSIGGTWGSASAQLRLQVYNQTQWQSWCDDLCIAPNQFIHPDLWIQHYIHEIKWNTEFSAADIILRCAPGGRIIFDTQQNEKSIGGLHLLDESDRPTTYVLSNGADVVYTEIDFSNYVPHGVKALLLFGYTTFTGDGSRDFVYPKIRAKGSSETTNQKLIANILESTNLTSGVKLSAGFMGPIKCDINGIIEYAMNVSDGAFTVTIWGYYI